MLTGRTLTALLAANLGAKLHNYHNPARMAADVAAAVAPLLDASAFELQESPEAARQAESAIQGFACLWVTAYKAANNRYPSQSQLLSMLREAMMKATGQPFPHTINVREQLKSEASLLVGRLDQHATALLEVINKMKQEAI